MRGMILLTAMTVCAGAVSVRDLADADAKTRDRASIDLELERQRLESELLEEAEKVLADRDTRHLGRTHTVLQAIATTRADNTVPVLVEAVEFMLDPDTFPLGVRVPTSAYYPVAQALRTIGNRAVMTSILSAATKPRDDKVLRIYAWILIEIVGKDAAKVVVERGKIGHVPAEQQGILRLLKMIDEEPLLEAPPHKPKGRAKTPLG